jgi:GNAT superfamily N-acetyltransferase
MLPELRAYYEDCITRGICLYWRTLGKARGMETHTGEIEYTHASDRRGIERIFNLNVPPGGLDRLLETLATGIRTGSLPDSVILPPGVKPDNLTQLLVLKGFTIDTSGVCMALDLENWRFAGLEEGEVRVTPIEDPMRLRQWVDIVNVALSGSEIMSYEQFGDLYVLEGGRFFLAWLGEVTAAACMTFRDGETVTLEMVATLQDYRCRGLATACITAALQELRARCVKTVTLRAEPAGISVYQKLGFQVVCNRVVASYRWNR